MVFIVGHEGPFLPIHVTDYFIFLFKSMQHKTPKSIFLSLSFIANIITTTDFRFFYSFLIFMCNILGNKQKKVLQNGNCGNGDSAVKCSKYIIVRKSIFNVGALNYNEKRSTGKTHIFPHIKEPKKLDMSLIYLNTNKKNL